MPKDSGFNEQSCCSCLVFPLWLIAGGASWHKMKKVFFHQYLLPVDMWCLSLLSGVLWDLCLLCTVCSGLLGLAEGGAPEVRWSTQHASELLEGSERVLRATCYFKDAVIKIQAEAVGSREWPWKEEDETVMPELRPLAMGSVNVGADSRDALVSWHNVRRSFHCFLWAKGLSPVPGVHESITGYLSETPPICPSWGAKGMTLWAWVGGSCSFLLWEVTLQTWDGGKKHIGLAVVHSLLAIAADYEGLACLLIPSWHSHTCHLYAFQCFATHTDLSTKVDLSEQQTIFSVTVKPNVIKLCMELLVAQFCMQYASVWSECSKCLLSKKSTKQY